MISWQLINRVCTPYTKEMIESKRWGEKPDPVARIIIDPIGASVFCFSKIWSDKLYGYKAGIAGSNFIDTVTYKATPEQYRRMEEIAKYPKSYSPEDAGVKHVLGQTRSGKKRTKKTWAPKKPITKL
jgi:hypothetical protein